MRAIVAAAALLPLVACGVGEVPPEDVGDEPADPVAGRYEVATTYDLSSSESVPGLLGDVLEPLAGLRDDPAATVFAILEASGDGVAELLNLLPPDVRADLEQKINDYVSEQIAAGGAAGDIIVWVDQIAEILTHFEVISQFEVGRADADGVARANHSLAAVRFPLDGQPRQVDVAEAISTLTIARDVDCEITDLEIGIAEHAFHLPLGELAVVGFNQALQNSLGAADVGEALGLVIDCPALAASVGEQCIGSFCIGEAELENVCAAGLDAVAAEIEKAIASIDFAELRLAGGHAALEDVAKQDGFAGQIDRWSQGSWQTVIDIDGLTIPVAASFEATRL